MGTWRNCAPPRDRLAARHDYDVRALAEEAKKRERVGNRKLVKLTPRPVEPVAPRKRTAAGRGRLIPRACRHFAEVDFPILSLLAQGVTTEELLDDYPRLEADDVRACIAWAHAVVAGDTPAAVPVAKS